jgi:hypothetical protein
MARPGSEQRRSYREKRRQAAWISVDAGLAPTACVVWDLSRHGARLTAAHSAGLPDVFSLTLGRDGSLRQHCRVVWRKQPYLGVKFIGAEEAERLRRMVARPQPKAALNWLSAPMGGRPYAYRNAARGRSNLLDFF